MNTFLEKVLGTVDVPTYMASFFFALLGALLVLAVKAKTRNKNKVRTPRNFSARWWIQDNWAQLMVGFLVTFLALRFSSELFGQQVTMYLALGIGMGCDRIAATLTKSRLKTRR